MAETLTPNKPQLLMDRVLASKASAGVLTTFTQFFDIRPLAGAFKLELQLTCPGDLSGVIGMTQGKNPPEASLIVSFPSATLLPLMKSIYQTECTTLNDQVQGGAAELTNVIFGMLKKDLNEHQGHAFKMSLPQVFLKDKYSEINARHGEALSIPFQFALGEFWVTIARTI